MFAIFRLSIAQERNGKSVAMYSEMLSIPNYSKFCQYDKLFRIICLLLVIVGSSNEKAGGRRFLFVNSFSWSEKDNLLRRLFYDEGHSYE